MDGVSKITSAGDVMLISFSGAAPAFLTETLNALADANVVVDMISQTTQQGGHDIRFSFTASFSYFDVAIKVIGSISAGRTAPMISGGYAKINLFGEDMVQSVGVAARALKALGQANIEIAMITTSDLDISLLVRQEEEDVAREALRQAFQL